MDMRNVMLVILLAVLVLGGLGYAVMRRGTAQPPPNTPGIPAERLQNELPPGSTAGGAYAPTGEPGQAGSTFR